MPAGAHRNQQKKIDSKNIATTFRKGNAITKLLTDAIQKENAGETGVYYWKKTEARDLFESAGVQFPGGSMQDGLIHSILKNDSPVNRKFVEQTETTVEASNIGYTKPKERSQGKGGDLRSKYDLTLTVVRKQYNGRGLFGKACRTALDTLSCCAPVPAGFTT